MRRVSICFGITVLTILFASSAAAQDRLPKKTKKPIDFEASHGRIRISIDHKPFATYVFSDKKITRPYFANVHAPGGIQVTRNHPPRKGDLQDHAAYHPGIWMAFGDISGNDYWRLKSKVVHAGHPTTPEIGRGTAGFSVRNRNLAKDGKTTVCEELCHIRIMTFDSGYMLLWDSTFIPRQDDFYFGDQEEMGLGVRVATPIAVNQKKGGRILNSHGHVNGREVWGKQAMWCDYSGMLKGKKVGVTIIPHPDNFRPCWFHARDYGLLLANPFGRKAFTRGKPSKLIVKMGESLRLRYGLFIHSRPPNATYDPNNAHKLYLKLAEKEPRTK